jgi:hypothetical protein
MYGKSYDFCTAGIMARKARREAAGSPPRLATTEARTSLPELVRRMRAKRKPSKRLLDDAVEIGPHRKGGAVLVPEVDARAHAEHVESLERRVRQLEDDLEDLLLAQALDQLYPEGVIGRGKPLEQVARELGFAHLLDDAR